MSTPKAPEDAKTRQSSADKIYQAIVDLTGSNQIATRKSILAETGLRGQVVDWHLKILKESLRIFSPANGVFAISEAYEDRPVSVTYLPNGRCKAEIGDHCIDMSIREGRMFAMGLAGIALQFGN